MQPLRNVKTDTVKPIIETVIESGSMVYTDEYSIYNFLDRSESYQHQVVSHSQGEYAICLPDEADSKVHTNTQEGLWSLLRPWIRPHRGVNKKYLPLYVAQAEYFLRQRKLTPAQQIRRVIQSTVSYTGYFVKESYRVKCFLTLCSV